MNISERFAWVRAVIAAQPRATLAEVAVAVTLAEHFNFDRGGAWPAQETIAALTRMTRRTVRRALVTLEDRGLIARIRDGGPRSSTVFTLVMPLDGAPQRRQTAPHSAISGRPTAPSDGAPQRHEQVSSRSENVGNLYCANGARSAYATRAPGAGKKSRRPTLATPVRL
jgi:DNA-binding transcriptional ArsR family regulator